MTTTNQINYQDTFIREVRATYHPTGTPPISIADPEQATAFIRSVLSDNSREQRWKQGWKTRKLGWPHRSRSRTT